MAGEFEKKIYYHQDIILAMKCQDINIVKVPMWLKKKNQTFNVVYMSMCLFFF